MKTLRLCILLLSVAFLASCGGHLSGTYVNSGGIGGKLHFISGGKVQVEQMGTTIECTYEKNGDQVKLISGEKNQILTIDKNGCLDGGEIMGKFCKQ
jgi:hypothetical protein